MECISSVLRPRFHRNFCFSKVAKIRCAVASKTYKITLLPGDGIGPEITSVAKDVLRLVGSQQEIDFKFTEMPVGGAAIDAAGVPLPNETLLACKESDAVLLAAIGGYKWDNNEPHLRPERGLLGLRAGLGVFANLRPATVLPQLADSSTLKRDVAEGVDIMVVRELTGGIYFGEPKGFRINEKGERIGFNTEVYSTSEVDRIARVAFGIARKRRGKLCSVDKANVLEASQLWRERVTAISNEYPDIELSHMYVDNASMQLIRNPKQGPGLFEPVHGSAPDIAGQDKANPLAMVLSVAMLLKYGLGEEEAANRINSAVLATLDKGLRTADLMSPGQTLVGCARMGEEVLNALDLLSPAAVLS